MDITKELLLNAGWQELRELYLPNNYVSYGYDEEDFSLTISPFSNMKSRDWTIHVDNCDFMTIGSCDIQTIEQFNDFMKLLDIDYKLSY